MSAWAEALQHNTHLTKLNLTVKKFDVADVHAIRTALRLNAALTDVTYDLGGVKSDDQWWSPQACADACRAAGAEWDLYGTKLSSRDVVHLAAALADPTVRPPVACVLFLCIFCFFPFLDYFVFFLSQLELISCIFLLYCNVLFMINPLFRHV